MMDYEHVIGEAIQLKDDLVKGTIQNDEGMDSDEMEALEEEEKFVRSMVKKGTM